MRFLQGLLGSFAALLTVTTLLLIVGADSSGFEFSGFAVTNFVFALISAVLIRVFENPKWNIGRYLLAGVLSCGVPLFFLMAPVVPFTLPPISGYLVVALLAAAFGAASSAGYRFLAGAKSR